MIHEWDIHFWEEDSGRKPIEAWFDHLSREHLISVTKELKKLYYSGNELKMPHSKALGDGLFELREQHYGYRIYYGFQEHFEIILFAAGDKKSQERDIKLAYERLKSEQR